jgi:hypothetical protein
MDSVNSMGICDIHGQAVGILGEVWDLECVEFFSNLFFIFFGPGPAAVQIDGVQFAGRHFRTDCWVGEFVFL